MTKLLLLALMVCALSAGANDNELRGTTRDGYTLVINADDARTSIKGSFDPGSGPEDLLSLERKDQTIKGSYNGSGTCIVYDSQIGA